MSQTSDTPQPDLKEALNAIRQDFADLGLVLSVLDDLRRRSDRLKLILLTELLGLQPKIQQVIDLLTRDQEGGRPVNKTAHTLQASKRKPAPCRHLTPEEDERVMRVALA